jgi:APA family basic amino acid/polyamine antiporter
VFTFWMLASSGYQAVYFGIFAFFLGVPVYIWMKVQRGEYGESPVIPIDYPSDSEFFVPNGNGHAEPRGVVSVPVAPEPVPHGAGLS